MGKWPITRPPEGDNCPEGVRCGGGDGGVDFTEHSRSGVAAWLAAARHADFFFCPAAQADVKRSDLTDRQAGVVDERERTARACFEKR